MKLNRAETLLLNNPARAIVQRLYEAPLLRTLGGSLDDARVLEIGCGQGVGMKVLQDQLGARHVTGVDLDIRQLRHAERLLSRGAGRKVALAVATIEQLPFADQCFDAVANFGALHHVEQWQAELVKVIRVLKPSGRFFFEEVTRAALNRWAYRTFLDHPAQNRFSQQEFIAELTKLGMKLLSAPRSILGGDIFIGVSRL